MKELNCLLLNGLKGNERRLMQIQIENSQPLLKRLEECIRKELKESDDVDWADFDNPNWGLKRAARDGYIKGLTRFLKYVIIGE